MLGDLLLRVQAEPQHISAFDRGAKGEELLQSQLDRLKGDGVLSLHDRRRRKSHGNIDHIVVSRSGVFVIDAKHYAGRVRRELVGGLFNSRERLYVNRRDCSQLAGKVRAQAAEVVEALAGDRPDLRVLPVLCFVEAEWGLFQRPFTFDRVCVTWPAALVERVRAEHLLSFDTVCTLAERLDVAFRPA